MKIIKLSINLLLISFVSFASNSLFNVRDSVKAVASEKRSTPRQSQDSSESENLDFSGYGRPGRRVGGGSRSLCPNTAKPLTALVPNSNVGMTVRDRPNFWFYVPYNPQQAATGEFVLQDRQENDIYRQTFDLPQTPGLVSLNLPQAAPALEVDRPYRWYFKLYCGDSTSTTANFVEGWITRIPLESDLAIEIEQGKNPDYQEYGSNSIWFDALDNLAQLRLEQDNPQLQNDWNRLLSAEGVNLGELSQQLLVGEVTNLGRERK